MTRELKDDPLKKGEKATMMTDVCDDEAKAATLTFLYFSFFLFLACLFTCFFFF